MHIGIVAGELSGDRLGAGLIQALRSHFPQAKIEGIGGPQMLAAGFHSLWPLETLSVMGLVEVIKHFPRLKQCRDSLRDHFLRQQPAVFIGIDAPDFNLGLECALKAAGIPTVHYVSPSVWAWRQYRWRKIARAVDLMLTLLPFEAEYYRRHQIPVQFIGHPLADEIPWTVDKLAARIHLGLPTEGVWVVLLPGSRHQEVRKLGVPFLHTARWLLTRHPDLRFMVPVANHSLRILLTQQIAQVASDLPLTLLAGQSHEAMAAADVVLTSSGTATLEAMLLKRPMVVAYRLAHLTYWIAKSLVHIPYFSLPNLLAQQRLVPEFLQYQVIPESLGSAVLYWLENPAEVEALQSRFAELHQHLRLSASQQAAQAVISVIGKGNQEK